MTYEEEIKKIREHPYKYIREHYENLYPKMGDNVMTLTALIPPSLILPPIKDSNGKKIPPRINLLLISPPGSAKTSLSEHFSRFAYDSFPFEEITPALLNSVLRYRGRCTIIVSDVARIFRSPILIKNLENITGEEGKLSRLNMNTGDEETRVDCVAYLAGTSDTLTSLITDGMLFRVSVMIIFYSEKEHNEILERINNGIGKEESEEIDKEQVIVEYYQQLDEIQKGESSEVKKVTGYDIPEAITIRIGAEINPLLNKMARETNFSFARELLRVYKFMVAHAFLNIFNRKVERGKLIIQEQDADIAIKLAKRDLEFKKKAMDSFLDVSSRRIMNMRDLAAWVVHKNKNNQQVTRDEYNLRKAMIPQ